MYNNICFSLAQIIEWFRLEDIAERAEVTNRTIEVFIKIFFEMSMG